MLKERRQALRSLVDEREQRGQTIETLPPQARLINFGLSRQYRSDHARLGTEDRPERVLRLQLQVAIEDLLTLGQRLVRHALKLRGGAENSIPVA